MATISYPAAGDGGLTTVNWASMYNTPDGVVNDFTGKSCSITIVSATNIAQISPGTVCVNGYFLEITGTEELTVPTAAGDYSIAAMYDPNLNAADDSGNALPAGPCRLVIGNNLDTSGGKVYNRLYRVVRTAGQALGAATVIEYRAWVGPSIGINVMPSSVQKLPEATLFGFGPYPIGTQLHENSTGEVWHRSVSTAGVPYWDRQSVDGPYTFPAPSALTANSADEPAAYYFNDNRSTVHLEGTLKRVSGAVLTSNGADVGLGTLPVGARPLKDGRWSVVGKPASGWRNCQVTVRRTGEVVLYDTGTQGFDPLYVDLSGISFRVRSS